MPTTTTQAIPNRLGARPPKRIFDKGANAANAPLCEKCDKPVDAECQRCAFIGVL